MTAITNLPAAIRPIAMHDLRAELANMQAGEALMLTVNGRQFIVINGSNWTQIVEEAGDHNALPLAPTEFLIVTRSGVKSASSKQRGTR
jgi:hypothetical protein